MYKIINVTDKEGNIKQDFIDDLKSIHPNMSGEISYPEFTKVGSHFCFIWNDETNRMLRTTIIEEYENNGNDIKVVTRNSIYYLEKENK